MIGNSKSDVRGRIISAGQEVTMLQRALVFILVALPIASAQEAPPAWKRCGTEIAWMTDKRPQRDNNQGGALGKTEVDLEELWADVKAKAKETGRPILWYIPKVEGSHMYRDAILDHYMNVAIWTDEAIVDLVGRRVVPLRAACAKELKSETRIDRWRVVEPAIALLDAEGRELWILERIRTFNADFIAAAIRAALEKHAPAPAPEGASGIELLKGGWFNAAAKKLADDPLALAELRRREGKLDEALKLADAAAAKGADAATARGRILVSAGRFQEAAEALGKSTSAEAAYFKGHALRALHRDEDADTAWAKLAETAPETRWGWRAAANVTLHKDKKAIGPASVNFEDVVWRGAPAAGVSGTRFARGIGDVEDVAKRAVAWLLSARSSKGSWNDSRYAYWPSPKIQPNVHMAVTALACAALLDWRDVDPKGVDAALAAAEPYLLDEANLARGQNEEPYADAYRLLYWARKGAGLTEKGAVTKNVERMNAVVGKLAAIQSKDGFWAHEYPNPFCTASVLQALLRARAAGATVEDKILATAADALKSTKDDSGRQAYAQGPPGSKPSDSSGRDAMCEAALLELKATDKATFEGALDSFWQHLDRRENVRVCDFHSDGQLAGFFFFNNILHTSETFGLLEGQAREEARAKMAAHLVKIPEIDGSFLDSHEMGKSYGTASALLALKNCVRK